MEVSTYCINQLHSAIRVFNEGKIINIASKYCIATRERDMDQKGTESPRPSSRAFVRINLEMATSWGARPTV
jgi:hypothetical protein